MQIWGYLALIVAVIGFFIFLYRTGYKAGYKAGEEKTNEAWTNKVADTAGRLADRSDPGFRVQHNDTKWGAEIDPEKRLEPYRKNEGQ